MASGGRSKDLLAMLECPVCFETMDVPKVLHCGHTVCVSCLRQLAGGRRLIKCPTCRGQTDLPPDGVSGLPNNPTLMQIKDMVQPKDKIKTSDSRSTLKADIAESMATVSKSIAMICEKEEEHKLCIEKLCENVDDHVEYLQDVLERNGSELKADIKQMSNIYLTDLANESKRFEKMIQQLLTCKSTKEHKELIAFGLKMNGTEEFSVNFNPEDSISVGQLGSAYVGAASKEKSVPDMVIEMVALAKKVDNFHKNQVQSGRFKCNVCEEKIKESCWLRCTDVECIKVEYDVCHECSLNGCHNSHANKFELFMQPTSRNHCKQCGYEGKNKEKTVSDDDQIALLSSMAKVVTLLNEQRESENITPIGGFTCDECSQNMLHSGDLYWLRCSNCEDHDVCSKCCFLNKHMHHAEYLKICKQPTAIIFCKSCGSETSYVDPQSDLSIHHRLL